MAEMLAEQPQAVPVRESATPRQGGRAFILTPAIFALFFVQLWFEVGGFTVRSEDLLVLLAIALGGLGVVLSGRLRYRHSPLSMPLIAWILVIGLGVMGTLRGSYPELIKQDALVNGVRLCLASALFFIAYFHPASFAKKARALIVTTLVVGVPTTIVCLLQIGYWDGWLPISLPAVLREMAEGSQQDRGREIFGLYIGNTGTHTWSGMLAMQALLVWLLSWRTRSQLRRLVGFSCFVLLSLILVRMSVRSSALGLFIAIVALALIGAVASGYPLNRLVKLVVVPLAALFALVALFVFAPDAYFVERIRQAIPQFENGRLTISRASNIYGRLTYMALAWQIFLDNPIFGSGFWSFTALGSALAGYRIAHVHNSYVQALSELGIVGAAVFAWLIGAMLMILWRTRAYLRRGGEHRLIWQWTTGGVVFLFSTAMVSNPFWDPVTFGLRMVLLGVLASALIEA